MQHLLRWLAPLALLLPLACGSEEDPDSSNDLNVLVNKGGSKNNAGDGGTAGSGNAGGSMLPGGSGGFPGVGGSAQPGGAGGISGSSGQSGGESGSSGQAGAAQAGSGGAGSGGGAGAAPLPCDPRFSFNKSPLKAGVQFKATVTDPSPFPWIDLQLAGPGAPTPSNQQIEGNGPYQWTWTVNGHEAGVLKLTFFRDKPPGDPGVVEATCQVQIEGDSGAAGTSGAGGSTGSSGTGGAAGTSGAGGSGGSGPPTGNRHGIGLVSQGGAGDHDLAAKLAGPGGHVLVIFADMHPGRNDADGSWKASLEEAYKRDLIPVVRLAPPWDNRNIRAMGESPTSYKGLAQAYKNVIASLPKRENWPIYLAVHNEPNLCYEWVCAGSGWLTEAEIAAEYAHYLADVADAIHSLNDPRLKVTMGALAPGGVTKCECGGSGWEGGTTALTFLQKMKNAVPGVFDKLDVWATHSYPAAGDGHSFFCPMPQAEQGLRFFEKELATIGKPSMKVLVTETGWSINGDAGSGCPTQSREQVAAFTVEAYQKVWDTHPNILGVTPFMLRDSTWDAFAWTQVDGNPYPVFNAVRSYRCAKPGAGNCN